MSAKPDKSVWFLPREHGATAMLLVPIFSAAILARQWRWSEMATVGAALAALSAKDPMVVLARQRFVWKQPHPETAAAARWFAGWMLVLIACGGVLTTAWPLRALILLGLGAAAFSVLAVAVNVKNRQRSTLFQIASAAALTSGSLATCLSATGSVASWCWWLWILSAMQATAGILVVHARLDARIALRSTGSDNNGSRQSARLAVVALACAGLAASVLLRGWIAPALFIVAGGYWYDLRQQTQPAALQLPLKKVGQRALALSILFTALLIAGLW
jgi:hypothetical protein